MAFHEMEKVSVKYRDELKRTAYGSAFGGQAIRTLGGGNGMQFDDDQEGA